MLKGGKWCRFWAIYEKKITCVSANMLKKFRISRYENLFIFGLIFYLLEK